MNAPVSLTVNAANEWRTETPGGSGKWARTPYPGRTRKKYFIVSTDTHIFPRPPSCAI